MKKTIKAIAHRLSRLPVIGHAVHITAALYHLPRLRAEFANASRTLQSLDTDVRTRLAAASHVQAGLSSRMHAVEQSSIGLLTGIATELGMLKTSIVDLTDSVAEVRQEAGAREELQGAMSALGIRLDDLQQKHAESAQLLAALRAELDPTRDFASRLGEVASRLGEIVVEVDTFKNAIDQIGSSLPDTRNVIPVGESPIERVSSSPGRLAALTHSLTNLVRSMPVALREIRQDQLRLHTLIGGIACAETSTRPVAAASDSLDVLFADSQRFAREEAARQRKNLESLSSRLDALAAIVDSSAAQLERFTTTVDFLVGRIEFVRREVLFELRYGARADRPVDALAVEPKIISEQKVAAALKQGVLRLNLGCGHLPVDGYINVDRRALPGVDVVADVENLPFSNGDAAEIMSSHVLEHFPQEQLTRTLLPYWYGLLREGGVFRAVVPDAKAMIEQYANGTYPYDDMREVLYGSQDYAGDFHYNMFTPDSLAKMLTAAGFEEVRIEAEAIRSGRCYEFEVRAIKPL